MDDGSEINLRATGPGPVRQLMVEGARRAADRQAMRRLATDGSAWIAPVSWGPVRAWLKPRRDWTWEEATALRSVLTLCHWPQTRSCSANGGSAACRRCGWAGSGFAGTGSPKPSPVVLAGKIRAHFIVMALFSGNCA